MTKAQEIAILRKAACELGENSYCGEWLREQIPAIERDMRLDMPVGDMALSWIAARERGDKMRAEAQYEAQEIVAAAKREAANIRMEIDAQLELAARNLRVAADTLVRGR